jgi:hypothetical protein
MINEFLDLYTPLMSGLQRPRTIRRIDDGRKVDKEKQKSLRGLPEHTLQDLGLYTVQIRA